MSLYIADRCNTMNNASIQFPIVAMSEFFESMFLSEFSTDTDPAEIAEIVRVSRANNATAGVTGVLMFDGTLFCTYLEGPETAVRRTFGKIAVDPRHTRFQPLHDGPIGAERRFKGWCVGMLAPDGPSPLLAFESLRGTAAIDHLILLFRESQKFGIHVV